MVIFDSCRTGCQFHLVSSLFRLSFDVPRSLVMPSAYNMCDVLSQGLFLGGGGGGGGGGGTEGD